uniref:SRP72 domain-containing protein n=1 Tax=Globodera pallida TaxID=36090 RepID=A0A183C5L8_GLOPA
MKESVEVEEMEVDGEEKVMDAAAKKRGRARKRKTRLPANFDPQIPPDPERWLPRQERTAYRKKLHKKYKDRDIGRGTQGAAAGAAANIDYSNASSKPGSSGANVSPHPSPKSEGPRQQRLIGQQVKKNKKKKGGKW